MNELKRLSEMIIELNLTTSSKIKKETLSKYDDIKTLLSIIYSNDCQFGITSSNIIKLENLDISNECSFASLESLLSALSNKTITGHSAIKAALKFISDNQQYEQIILNSIDKDLKCRIDVSTINKVFSDLITTFDVALALDIENVSDNKKPNFGTETWYASRKLDGVRCLVIVENNKARAYSRRGKEFHTVDKVLKAIEIMGYNNIVFDGEMCMMVDGLESYTDIMKLIKRKDYTIEQPMFNMFDMIPINDFKSKTGSVSFNLRQLALNDIINDNLYDHRYLSILPQTVVRDYAHLKELQDSAISNGWEGIMIRKDIGYEGKRSSNLLKIKMFKDAEYIVEDLEMGKMRIVEAGIDVDRDILSAIIIKHKGYKVNVGSGWSKEQRLHYFQHPEELIGKTVTVKYFAESSNSTGGLSLRFPVIKYVHGDKRSV